MIKGNPALGTPGENHDELVLLSPMQPWRNTLDHSKFRDRNGGAGSTEKLHYFRSPAPWLDHAWGDEHTHRRRSTSKARYEPFTTFNIYGIRKEKTRTKQHSPGPCSDRYTLVCRENYLDKDCVDFQQPVNYWHHCGRRNSKLKTQKT